MYSIKEVQIKSGLPASTLRYYEKEGILPDVGRDEGGRRVYTEKQIDWIRFLMAMKDTGMTIEEIKAYLELNVKGEATIQERRDFLVAHKKKVEEHVAQTQHNLEKIIQKIAFYDRVVMGKSLS
ncbi:MerR family transcriptional regulator [Paenibacillus sp. SEL3]|uniref:MerR family transcriptional regulator n=1 Tax=Paenibacillus polymyxa TaxID=1406 RepID=A0A8I1IR54_PAEPO|nr:MULTISPECIES: MerR family transcriptional regulator [Paenibacillus]KAF6573905.1 MerR family transcriptional regulator [Paenibacillus sp. EKM206P]KAF6588210.1 MerR family transcriptional regulator [Paenibacillus sp. EKM205P]KEO79870.1 MerR family transcriptional regulator [Paenibacillus polymyxa]MBM0635774.1 MerR family transcriptional regulator [Paenibacillus polymyxa]MBO3282884.1 MerR family transcriptional regulator [Paenibacillus polymyxa]